jgi:hypothetical protein
MASYEEKASRIASAYKRLEAARLALTQAEETVARALAQLDQAEALLYRQRSDIITYGDPPPLRSDLAQSAGK